MISKPVALESLWLAGVKETHPDRAVSALEQVYSSFSFWVRYHLILCLSIFSFLDSGVGIGKNTLKRVPKMVSGKDL